MDVIMVTMVVQDINIVQSTHYKEMEQIDINLGHQITTSI